MLDHTVGATELHFQRCQVFHAHQFRVFEQRDLHLSQLESHEQDSSDVSLKIKLGSINQDIGRTKRTIQSEKASNCYHIFIEEALSELLQYVLIVLGKLYSFRNMTIPDHFSAVVSKYLDASFQAFLNGVACLCDSMDFIL